MSVACFVGVCALRLLAWKRGHGGYKMLLLEGLGILCAGVFALLLNKPFWIVREKPVEKSPIVFLVDGSKSMQTKDISVEGDNKLYSREQYLQKLLKSPAFTEWKKKARFEIIEGVFSKKSRENPMEYGTDFITPIKNLIKEHARLQAVVVLGDGLLNAPIAPLEVAMEMRRKHIAFVGMGIGSLNALDNISIEQVVAPRYGIMGEHVQVHYTIQSTFSRDIVTTLRIEDSKTHQSKSQQIVIAPKERFSGSFLWRLDKEESTTLLLSMPLVQGEKNTEDNQAKLTLLGRKERLKVLLIDSLPRWEYRFIRNALQRDPGVEVDCLLYHPQVGMGGGEGYLDAFPEKKEVLQGYDVVFLGDVGIHKDPQKGLTKSQAILLKGLVKELASGLVFIPGRRGEQHSLVNSPLGELIPVILDAKTPQGVSQSTPSRLLLSQEGKGSLLTMLADSPSLNPQVWESLPGFYWYAPVIKAKGGSQVLGIHADARNAYGRIPMLITRSMGAGKVLYLAHDSAWRWRRGVEDLYHYRFWGQVARWMSYQRNMAKGKRLRLYSAPERPRLGTEVEIVANAFDVNYAPLNEGEVSIKIRRPKGRESLLILEKSKGAWGRYTGRVKIDEQGSWQLIGLLDGKEESALSFETQMTPQEPVGLPADFSVFEQMAALTESKSFSSSQLAGFLEWLNTLHEPQIETRRIALWCHWITAAVCVFLLGSFWMLRKYNGFF